MTTTVSARANGSHTLLHSLKSTITKEEPNEMENNPASLFAGGKIKISCKL